MLIVTYLDLVSFTPSGYIRGKQDRGWRFGEHPEGSADTPERMRKAGT